ncbi:MAG TPA: Dabb family protein [Gemmataceae bacterium]|nr:Dabb family protein [Gemmataceae bacterium]
MRKQLSCVLVLALGIVTFAAWTSNARKNAEAAELVARDVRKNAEAEEQKGPLLVHNVYFSLKDNSAEAKKKLVDACKKYLTEHPGEIHFGAGTRAEDLNREVNDRDFDVSLHIVFKDKAAHDKYAGAERHLKFIDENKDNWKKVRVFDSVIRP